MKYEVLNKVVDTLVENNIEIDKEKFEILFGVKNYNQITERVLLKILKDNDVIDKNKFLKLMVSMSDNYRGMNTLLNILNDEFIRENDEFINLIMYKFSDLSRNYMLDNIKLGKEINNKDLLDFILKQQEIIQIRILKCIKIGLSNEQINKIISSSNCKINEVLLEIENELLDKLKQELLDKINDVYMNPSIDNLKELKNKQDEYNEIIGVFKRKVNSDISMEITLNDNKRLVYKNDDK